MWKSIELVGVTVVRKSRMVLLVAIFAALALMLSMTPAHAATQGGGTVDGTVTITSPATGIPTATQPAGPTSYLFTAINITGVFRNGGGNFAGGISITNVTGGSPSENTLGGSGNVNAFNFSGPTGAGVGSINGSCSGTFVRNGSIVRVTLDCSASINGGPTDTGTVTVVAQFSPTNGNGVTTGVKAANFAGVYASR